MKCGPSGRRRPIILINSPNWYAQLLRSNTLANAVGVLKEEMRALDSAIIQSADKCSVPAGERLPLTVMNLRKA
ncbi:hypothetical protein QNN00_19805 [Bacillus velezensis]|nr:hypothetical protein [Bacillus velezensis]